MAGAEDTYLTLAVILFKLGVCHCQRTRKIYRVSVYFQFFGAVTLQLLGVVFLCYHTHNNVVAQLQLDTVFTVDILSRQINCILCQILHLHVAVAVAVDEGVEKKVVCLLGKGESFGVRAALFLFGLQADRVLV